MSAAEQSRLVVHRERTSLLSFLQKVKWNYWKLKFIWLQYERVVVKFEMSRTYNHRRTYKATFSTLGGVDLCFLMSASVRSTQCKGNRTVTLDDSIEGRFRNLCELISTRVCREVVCSMLCSLSRWNLLFASPSTHTTFTLHITNRAHSLLPSPHPHLPIGWPVEEPTCRQGLSPFCLLSSH